jgi:hypothetical protein
MISVKAMPQSLYEWTIGYPPDRAELLTQLNSG